MRLIAHRPFRDERSMEQFDPQCLVGFDGVELDIRAVGDGSVAVFHAPIMAPLRRAASRRAKSLTHVFEALSQSVPPIRTYLFDVKGAAAARRIGEALASVEPECEIAFICWHAEEVEILRQRCEKTRIFLGVAPLGGARLTRRLPDDFVVFNRFPFVARAQRFRSKSEHVNEHKINVRNFKSADAKGGLLEGVTGVCFHKYFFNKRLASDMRDRGLEIAVYGFPSRRDREIAKLEPLIDFAIADPDHRTRRKSTRRSAVA